MPHARAASPIIVTPGGGIPEIYEFRFKLSPMFMRMDGLRDGTGGIIADLLGMPAQGKYMAVPTAMGMTMLKLSLGRSFGDDFFAGLMPTYKGNRMAVKFSPVMQTMTGQSGSSMESRGITDTMLLAKYCLFADDPLIPTRQSSLFFALSLPSRSIDEQNRRHPLAARRTSAAPAAAALWTSARAGHADPFLAAPDITEPITRVAAPRFSLVRL